MKNFKKSLFLFVIAIVLFSCKGTPKSSSSNKNAINADGLLFVEVESGQPITLDLTKGPTDKYDIYCMYTNISPDPSINVTSGLPEVYQKADSNKLSKAEFVEKGQLISRDGSDSKEGDKLTFWRTNDENGDTYKQIEAILMHKRKISTKNGDRTLEIWQENGMQSDKIPSTDEYIQIADCFLKEGNDNDIYDLLTNYCGSDDGFRTALYNPDYIEHDGVITLLYCDVGGQGPITITSSSEDDEDDEGNLYEVGFYDDKNNVKGAEYSNKRSMIFINAYAAGGDDFLGIGILTLAHEFQHLLHAQYFNINEDGLDADKKGAIQEKIDETKTEWSPDNISNSIDECFSSMVEEYICKSIIDSTGKQARDPFYVTYNNNKINMTGYITEVKGNARTYSMGSSYLRDYAKVGLDKWDVYQDDYGYGIVAAFGHYLLCNYGMEIIKAYRENSQKKGKLDGIVAAINDMNKNDDMTRTKLIKNFCIATLLSRQANIAKPYAFNNKGWIDVSGQKIPSVNLWLYRNTSESAYGFNDFFNGTLCYGTSQYALVKAGVDKGIFECNPVDINNPNVAMTIIAVPVV